MSEKPDDGNGFVHAECPNCGRVGGVVNMPSTGRIDVHGVATLEFCYGEFGVVFHKDGGTDE